ncbi:MAG TPA: hypothetical protein VGG03_14370 [Thermoanaerobaculia bacterium]|jgi:hypothetical protein
MGVFFLFLLATCLGSLSTLYWIPESDMGRGYFQMNALVVLGLLGIAAAVVALHPFHPFGDQPAAGVTALAAALAGSFLYYAAIWRESWDLCRWPLTLAAAGSAAALLLAGPHVVSPHVPLPHRGGLLAAALLASALLLGWSLITMLLGHWYLVAPKLTFRHLTVFCWVLLGVVVLRLLSVGATLAMAAGVNELVEPHPLRVLTSLGGQGIFFWFRLLWGLAIPLALAIMALHCARQRSNQSATGILYVLVVGAFIGEITGYYLSVTTGVPV